MSIFQIKKYSFTYPLGQKPALQDINLTLEEGKFYVLCGKSGCGKSTLLRQLKSVLAPKGEVTGAIYYRGRKLSGVPQKEQSTDIGFVFQNPDNQIVTDKVWHELAFGLESLGYDSQQIHLRVAEMASYFGITDWFHKDVSELSGGQKQLLNLAAIMTMHPKVLILDEPTSQLDPVASSDFLNTLRKINIEFGITILLSEHNLEDVVSMTDSIMVMDTGKIIAQGTVEQIGKLLKEAHHDMFQAMPTAMRIYAQTGSQGECPYTVAMGRRWLAGELKNADEGIADFSEGKSLTKQKTILEMKEVSFRYEKDFPDVVCHASLQIYEGEIFALMGGNGTGKSTALHLLAGLLKPHHGEILLKGKNLRKYPVKELYHGMLNILPQDPTALFVNRTVEEELDDIDTDGKKKIEVIELTHIASLLQRHPFDISGGEQQRVALAKILLCNPRILLLDEPTKGFDAQFKKVFGAILQKLKSQNVTIVIVSHDLEFCAQYVDRIGMFFDGSVATVQEARSFFAGNHFYTTAANRMAREFFPNAITEEEVTACINAQKGKNDGIACVKAVELENCNPEQSINADIGDSREKKSTEYPDAKELESTQIKVEENGTSLAISSWKFLFGMLLLVPITIWTGITIMGDRKYIFISLLIVIYATVPFLGLFQKRKAEVRKLVVIAVLTALAVAGRAAFFMVPSIKPMAAVTIVAGISMGAKSGFMVGALSMLVSNMLFGQGPWTPYQMFAMGLIGLFAGMIFRTENVSNKRIWMCLYGFASVILLYGGIMNPASLIMSSYEVTSESLFAIYLSGLPLDLVHAASTVIFLFLAGKPMQEKLKRVKIRYHIAVD